MADRPAIAWTWPTGIGALVALIILLVDLILLAMGQLGKEPAMAIAAICAVRL